jgi:hypothetical protein
VILTENTARIIGNAGTEETGSHTLRTVEPSRSAQATDEVWMDLDEAEALFLVLDTMLHPEEE